MGLAGVRHSLFVQSENGCGAPEEVEKWLKSATFNSLERLRLPPPETSIHYQVGEAREARAAAVPIRP